MKSGKAALVQPTAHGPVHTHAHNEEVREARASSAPAAPATPVGMRVMARDPFSADEILAGFYNPSRGTTTPLRPVAPAVPQRHTARSHPARRVSDGVRPVLPNGARPGAGAPSLPPGVGPLPLVNQAVPLARPLSYRDLDVAEAPAPLAVPLVTHQGPEVQGLQELHGLSELTEPYGDVDPHQDRRGPAVVADGAAEELSGPAAAAPGAALPGEGARKAKPTHYKIVCISLYTEDIARLEAMVGELKRRGHTKANKSQLIRYALEQVDLNKVPRSG